MDLPPVIPSVPTPANRFITAAVTAWSRALPTAILGQVAGLALLSWALAHAGTFSQRLSTAIPSMWRHATAKTPSPRKHLPPRPDGDAGLLDPYVALASDAKAFVLWLYDQFEPAISLISDPRDPTIVGIVTTVVLLLLMYSFLRLLLAVASFLNGFGAPRTRQPSSGSSRGSRRRSRPDRRLSPRPHIVREERQYRPVLVLLQCLERTGVAYQRTQNGPLLDAPRVTFPDAERAIWHAGKTRHTRMSRPVRRAHKAHAAKVIGALRAAEGRQDTDADTGKVLEDIALMLLTITARYAEGRTGELLDHDTLDGVTSATSFEWVRLVLFGGIIVATASGCAVLNIPTPIAAPFVGLVLLVAGKALLGYRLNATETLDLIRGPK
ncbi:hypothetical protein [Streptomyces sp. NPDC017993]|uniref:hypothetical protein n=1 Tax=Streptomyces sp. NPDC017993 TaxID=3365027 RepID=UPI003787735D